ncbi:hypothetical protein DMN91_012195, partial [Ooceraea biroi]
SAKTTTPEIRLSGTTLIKVDSIRDLGVTFCSDLSFKKHIETITNNALGRLGFVNRACKFFSNVGTLRLLYCSLVRPLLEYASIVWAPYLVYQCDMIERIQHRFLRRVSFRLLRPMNFFDHDYDYLHRELGLLSLRDRRTQADLVFVRNIISGRIDCPDLLECIGLHVPELLFPVLRFKVGDNNGCIFVLTTIVGLNILDYPCSEFTN